MKFTKPRVNYLKLRFNNLFTDFKYLWPLLYWIVYGIGFAIVERVYPTVESCKYHMWCELDAHVPFLEIFVIPYLLWFVFLVVTHVYTLLYDVALYKKLIKYIIITYTTSLVIFFLFPNAFANPSGASLRPDVETLGRSNILLDFMKYFWANVDTPTNVCPSLHVIGTMACMFTVLHSERLKNKIFKAFIILVSISICVSTVFLRQHSILDVVAAVPICIIAEIICFAPHLLKFKKKATVATSEQPIQAPTVANNQVEQDTPIFLAFTFNFIWIPSIFLMRFLLPQYTLTVILIGLLGIIAEVIFFVFIFSKYKKNAKAVESVAQSIQPIQDNPVTEEVAVTDNEAIVPVMEAETDVMPTNE